MRVVARFLPLFFVFVVTLLLLRSPLNVFGRGGGPGSVTTPKDTYTITGSPLGGVKFEHKLHATTRNIKCEACHHPSRPEHPSTVAQESCMDCHTKTATPPMKTKLQGAFHNPTATAGTCIDCHKTEDAKGKKAPVKCMDCHKKENT